MRPLTLLLLLALPACKPTPSPPPQLEPPIVALPDAIRLLDPAAAQTLITTQPRLQNIDCRLEDEFRNGPLPSADPNNQFKPEETRQRLQTLDPARPTLVYCALGARSRETALLMNELGFQDIAILDGGIHAWLQAKLPLTK
jgi:rhodanese-related sulfurtransferase